MSEHRRHFVLFPAFFSFISLPLTWRHFPPSGCLLMLLASHKGESCDYFSPTKLTHLFNNSTRFYSLLFWYYFSFFLLFFISFYFDTLINLSLFFTYGENSSSPVSVDIQLQHAKSKLKRSWRAKQESIRTVVHSETGVLSCANWFVGVKNINRKSNWIFLKIKRDWFYFLIWLGFILRHINHCGLSNAKFCLYAPPWGLSTPVKELSAAARIMQSSSKELSTLVADRV